MVSECESRNILSALTHPFLLKTQVFERPQSQRFAGVPQDLLDFDGRAGVFGMPVYVTLSIDSCAFPFFPLGVRFESLSIRIDIA
jgi:hypothetical protein